MIKKKTDEKVKGNPNSKDKVAELLQTILNNQKELVDRLEAVEKGKVTSADSLLKMVNFLYDTDDKHLPELTRLPINAVSAHAFGMCLESIFDEDVQSGKVPLSSKLRNHYFRLLRSVGGVHLGRGVRLAEEQAQSEAEEAEEMELGGEE
jgi:hypothetical protein